MTRRFAIPLAALLALAGCGGNSNAGTAGPAPAPTVSTKAPLTPEEFASLGLGSDIPPVPSQEKANAYLASLERINPELLEDRDPTALVNRGRDQCTSIKEWPGDEAKWLWYVNQRFTSPEHPEGFGDAVATEVLAAVRKYICPTY